MIRVLVASIASIVTAASAGAQTPTVPAPAPTPAAACELHVWPAERFNARTTGWGVGFGLIGALADSAGHADGDAQRRTSLSSALDSPGQTAALNSLALADLLKQQPATVVLHDAPLERHTVNDIKSRRATSNSPCYSELIVADVLYQKAAVYGRSLKTLFIYRQFGDAPEAKRVYKSWGGNGLKIFPPKPGEDIQAANDELVSVFKADFEEFARNEVAAQTATH